MLAPNISEHTPGDATPRAPRSSPARLPLASMRALGKRGPRSGRRPLGSVSGERCLRSVDVDRLLVHADHATRAGEHKDLHVGAVRADEFHLVHQALGSVLCLDLLKACMGPTGGHRDSL